MPTIADLQRRAPRSLRVFLERQGLRGGPFSEVFDPEGMLVMPTPTLAIGRALGHAEPASARLILREGVVDDRFLRRWLLSDEAAIGADFIDLALEDREGEALARWSLADVRVLEVADRRRRSDDDPRFEYVLFAARVIVDR